MKPSSDIERMHFVEGRKNGQPFREGSRCYIPQVRCDAYFQERIDNPPVDPWQPTILRVVHLERSVTPWVEVAGPFYLHIEPGATEHAICTVAHRPLPAEGYRDHCICGRIWPHDEVEP